jgi:CRP-like cAMP-binding protein
MPEPSRDRDIEGLLSRTPLFAGLEPEYLEYLAAHAAAVNLAADAVLFAYGDEARHFYLVADGRVSVEVAAIEGPALELQRLGPGAVLGWSWLIAPYRWNFQARATARSVVIEFDGPRILARCERDPAFGYELVRRFSALMSERLNFARQKMMEEWKPAGFA